MARPKKPIAQHGAYRIVERNGIYILYHGESVRQTFKTRDDAVKYLEHIKGARK